jgi:aminopeptidase N
MLQHFLSDETFARGLSAYLHRMEYKSASPDDLYASLNEIAMAEGALPAHITVKEIMDTWANQRGYPMLTVERTSSGQVMVTQERFLLQASSAAQPQTWWVPYNMASKSSPNFDRTTPDGWIPQGTRTVSVRPNGAVTWDNDDWIVFNKQGTSYYRVNYDDGLWAAIIEELVQGDFNLIHLNSRAQLIDDAYYMARVMRVGYDTAFGLMEYLSNEQDYLPWASSNRVLTTVDRMIASLDSYDHFRVGFKKT